MKHLKNVFTAIVVFILIQTITFAAPTLKTETNAWQKLDSVQMIPHVTTYYEGKQKIKTRIEDTYVIQLKEIRQELEKAGIDEPVAIEIRYNSRLITRLGTYEPTVSYVNGIKEVKFNSIPPGKRIPTNLTHLNTDSLHTPSTDSPDETTSPPPYLELYFKNQHNQTKARVYVSFLKALPY